MGPGLVAQCCVLKEAGFNCFEPMSFKRGRFKLYRQQGWGGFDVIRTDREIFSFNSCLPGLIASMQWLPQESWSDQSDAKMFEWGSIFDHVVLMLF